MSVSFIVPFYNEEKNLLKVYRSIKKLVKKKKIKYELIFIDDGSSDNSVKILKTNIKTKFKLIVNNRNKGLGYSLKKGMKNALSNYVIWIPSDDEHDVNGLLPLFKNFNNFDLIIPYVINSNIRPIWRRILSYTFALYIRLVFFYNIPYFNGLVLYKNEILKKSLKSVENNSFSFIPEILLRSLKITNNYKIIGYKIKKSANFKSSAFTIKNIILTIYKIIRLRFII